MIANQPWFLGGVIDADAAQKAARFVRTCNAFGLPLVVLVDTPGFLPGTKQEGLGVIRHGAKLLHAFAEAVVPKVTVVLRKAYGGAYISMNSKDLGADLALAWPDAEIGIMGPKQAVGVVHRRALAEADDPEAERDRLADEYADGARVGRGRGARGLHRRARRAARDAPPPGGRARGAVGRRRVRQRRGEHPAMTTYVALGDSFTAGLEPGEPRWADEVAQALGPGRYENLAVGGRDERATSSSEQLTRALELEPDLVTLVCGANDVLESAAPDVDAYARAARAHVRARCGASAPARAVVTATYPDISRFLDLRPRSRARVEKGMRRFNDAVPGGGPAPRRGAARGLRPPGGRRPRRPTPTDGFHPSRRGPPRAAAAARSCARSRSRASGRRSEAPA